MISALLMEAPLMHQKIQGMWPEICLFITTCVVMVIGLSPSKAIRRMCAPLAFLGLLVSGLIALKTAGDIRLQTSLPQMPLYGKLLVAGIGMILVCLVSGTADRELETAVDRGAKFDPLRATRAEFWAFFLFSLTGLMLCAGADDLIMLFLALELTSLPTYVMVSLSTNRNRSMESGVKYFFLGALGAAIFLYGFALIYGGTGTTNLARIHEVLTHQALSTGFADAAAAQGGSINMIAMAGLVLAIIGVCFKIAAVPMHFYTPDVYQGASAAIAGFLAFVPKTAGFFAIMLLTSAVGWRFGESGQALPGVLRDILFALAVGTMTVGNVLAILQTSVKRILAYSSIAHSGYMLVGIIAGPGRPGAAGADAPAFASNGLAAVLFYLLSYGIMTIGAFAVLASLERRNSKGELEEVDSINDLRGLCHSHPLLGWTMVLSAAGLLGLPPLLGFFGKLPLFTSAINAGEIPLVLILGLNSAIAAYYYLRLMYVPFIESADRSPNLAPLQETPFASRRAAAMIASAGVIVLALGGSTIAEFARESARPASEGTPKRLPASQRGEAPVESPALPVRG